jgi:DNA-binding NarL/FixJ family response regulator
MKEPIQVLVADDHELIRIGVSVMLEDVEDIEIVAEASNGLEMIEKAEKFIPDVILADIKMPVMDGVEATRIITKKLPGIIVIAYSMYTNGFKLEQMIGAGARGYLLKGAHSSEIVKGIRAVYDNHSYYCSGSAEIMKELVDCPDPGIAQKIDLNDREKEIIPFLCKGMSSKEIAKKIHRAPKTVENYRSSLLEKTGCKNTASLVYFLTSHDIFPGDSVE